MKAIAAFSDFVGRTFAVWVIIFAVLGFLLPSTFSVFAPWIVVLLGIMFVVAFSDIQLLIDGRSFIP